MVTLDFRVASDLCFLSNYAFFHSFKNVYFVVVMCQVLLSALGL